MTGVLPVLKLMFTVLPLQRWFLWIGASLALAVVAATLSDTHGGATWWAPVAMVGSGVFLFSLPTPASALLSRHLAASRALRLIPRGRIQLLVSGVIAQLLIASIAAAWVIDIASYLHVERRLPPAGGLTTYSILVGAFVGAFAMLTLFFVTLYYAHRFHFLILLAYVVILRTLSVIFPDDWPAREFITSGTALAGVFIGTWIVWLLFGIAFLTAGRVTRPVLNQENGLLTRWLAPGDGRAVSAPSEQRATRTLLTGRHRGHYLVRSLMGIGAGVLCGYYWWTLQGHPALQAGEERLLAVLNAYMGGVAAAAVTYPMMGRARYLWLKACLDRGQLFRAVEAEGWRALLSIIGFALALCAYLCFLAQVPWAVIVRILLLSFVSGAAMIYLVLLSTRGWRVLEGVLVAALSALWLVALIQSAFAAAGGSRLLVPLLAAELLLVPLLRGWAKSRWSSIDWLLNRPHNRLSAMIQ
ncbi:MAG TPA: hypothetical protein VFX20_16600 [Steroidobacteraceae bacterium]|nr:hypothetical protein [Steroidobacteraceae bacterium]